MVLCTLGVSVVFHGQHTAAVTRITVYTVSPTMRAQNLHEKQTACNHIISSAYSMRVAGVGVSSVVSSSSWPLSCSKLSGSGSISDAFIA
eukprot:1382666-Rhodomonas_salina.1